MRYIFLFGISFLFSTATGMAQDSESSEEPLRRRLLKRFDTDGDGKLSESEREAARKAFQRFRPDPNAPEPERLTWTILGEQREALVYFPKQSAKGGSPVVFGFHGHGGSMRNADRSFGFQKYWPEAIVVYMQGLPTPGKLTDPEGKRNGWQHSAEDQNSRDLKFFDAVLKTFREKREIDENRIYASGHSNGGGFTYLLWCHRPDVFAAIAPSAAASPSLRTVTPKPVPVMHLAGTKDELVKFTWQQLTMSKVRQINGCEAEGQAWAKNGTLYPSKSGTPFVAYIHDGTHKYPAEGPELIVRFFKEHNKSATENAKAKPKASR